MKAHTFRQHDQVPPHVASPIYRQLLQEWVNLNALTSSTAAIRRWGRLEPALAGHTRPCDLVDAVDAADPDRTDELLLALIRLFQQGHQLAGRVVLQAMLPKLASQTLRTAPTSTDNAWTEDRRHIAIAEFWDVLTGYPVERRTRKVAGNLALDTLHRLTSGRRVVSDIPVDPTELPINHHHESSYTFDHDTAAGSISADADLIQVITWGVARQAITPAEGTLLSAAYLPSPGTSGFSTAAEQLGISPTAVRQRCSRASRRLTHAVRTELAPTKRGAAAASA